MLKQKAASRGRGRGRGRDRGNGRGRGGGTNQRSAQESGNSSGRQETQDPETSTDLSGPQGEMAANENDVVSIIEAQVQLEIQEIVNQKVMKIQKLMMIQKLVSHHVFLSLRSVALDAIIRYPQDIEPAVVTTVTMMAHCVVFAIEMSPIALLQQWCSGWTAQNVDRIIVHLVTTLPATSIRAKVVPSNYCFRSPFSI